MAKRKGKFDSAGDELKKRLAELNLKYSKDGKPAIHGADALTKKKIRQRVAKLPPPFIVKSKYTSLIPKSLTPTEPEPVVYGRKLPRMTKQKATSRSGATIKLTDALEGTEERHDKWGKSYLISTPVSEVEGAATLSPRFCDRLVNDTAGLLQLMFKKKCELTDLQPEDFIFMDIETTGLGNSPVFLIGVMVWNGTEFEVIQYLARNYAEERAIIAMYFEECARRKLLVTFNGKSFDVPFIRTRCAATGVPHTFDLEHLDLLHVSRRLWKNKLPNCKLQTLERHFCGRIRTGDIPGSEIPDAYHEYVRTDNAIQLVAILKHNLLDLVTLADIITHFPLDPEDE